MQATDEQTLWLESAAQVDEAASRSAAADAFYAVALMSVVALFAGIVALL